MIPAYLGKRAQPVYKLDDAAYSLLTVMRKNIGVVDKKTCHFTQLGLDYQNIMIQGVVTPVRATIVGDMVCYYMKLDRATYSMRNLTRILGANMCGNFNHYFSTNGSNYYEDMTSDDRYNHDMYTYRYRPLAKIREKITQNHHLHVRLKDLYGDHTLVDVRGDEAVLCTHLDRYNNIESTHATFITYFRAAPKYAKRFLINLIRDNNGLDMDWLKTEGTRCKQLQHYTEVDLTPVFELAVLVNRVETSVDWLAEKEHRIRPEVVNIPYSEVYKHAATLFGMAKEEGKRPMKQEWREYWGQRAVMMPAGAVHSTIPGEIQAIKQLPRAIKNKKGLASLYHDVPQTVFTGRQPKIEAFTSTKYEWGKVRALYGCDFTTHVNADFGLMMCEDTFPQFVPTGSAATESNVKRVLSSIDNTVPFCFDYDDFNSQHSIESMIAVIDAWRSVYIEDLSNEQLQAVDWTMSSIKEQYVNNSYTGDRYKSQGTLFSGWRLTTFINTALNYVYLAAAGINENCVMSVHNGDDVYAGLNNLQQAVTILKNCKKYSIRANPTKMSVGTIAEFLRIDMRAKKGTNKQYLSRGISTFVHSRVESESPLSLRGLVSAFKTRYDEVCQRGGESKEIKRLYRKQLDFTRRLFNVDKEIIEDLLTVDRVCGGIIDGDDESVKNYRLEDYTLEQLNTSEQEQKVEVMLARGAKSYTTYLKTKFPELEGNIKYKRVIKSIKKMFNLEKSSVMRVDASRSTMITERALKGAWRNDSGIGLINKVRMGVDNILMAVSYISNAKAAVLQNAEDPVKWLSILM